MAKISEQKVVVRVTGVMDNSAISKGAEQIQKAFEGIKPGSAAESKFNALFKNLERQALKVSDSLERGFSSVGELNKTEAELDNITRSLEKIDRAIKAIKFTDLAEPFNEQQKGEMASYIKQIDELKNKIKSVRAQGTQQFIKTDPEMIKQARDLGIAETDSAEAVRKAVNKKMRAYEDESEAVRRKVKETVDAQKRETQSQLDTMLIADKSKFKGGGRAQAAELLKSLDIELTDKMNLASVNAALDQYYDEMYRAGLATKDTSNALSTLDQQYTTLVSILGRLDTALATTDSQSEGFKQEITQTKAEMEKLRQKAVETAKGNEDLGTALRTTEQSANSMSSGINTARGILDEFNATQNKISNIEDIIKRWTGFGMVAMQVRKAVSTAITDIRELDTAMGNIAVVTEMTTADLWKQVDAYMAIAQQYGVSTKGVYEVSQLYYQQGWA